MARAETIESVGEAGGGRGGGGGGSGPLPHHSTCRMELPGPFHTWPPLLTTTTISTGALHLHHLHHQLHPFQALPLPHPHPHPHPEGRDAPPSHQPLPALSPSQTPPPSPLCNQRGERRAGGAAEARADLDREEHREASSRQGPLPDLLPQNEHPSWALPPPRAPWGEAVQELEVSRLASQLRAIGDEFNATVLRRAHAAPHWQDWRDGCRRLLNLISQTLSTLYRLT